MFRCSRILLTLIIVFMTETLSQAQAPKQVLAIMMDGAEYAVVRQQYLTGHLPNLAHIGALGQMTAITPCAPEAKLYWPCQLTITAVQHATMLTGADFTVTGIVDNRDWLNTPIPAGLTIFERLKAINPAIHTAYIRGEGHCLRHDILNDQKWPNALWAMDDHSCGDQVTKVLAHLQEWRDEPYLIILHFDTPDRQGHEFGYNSVEYREALRENDTQIGVLLPAVRATTRLYVFADHGFGTKAYGYGLLSLKNHRDDAQNTFMVRNNGSHRAETWAMHQLCGHWLRYFGGAGLQCGPQRPVPQSVDADGHEE